MSWKHGCYIHSGLSGPMKHVIAGPQALEFLTRLCINGFETFPVGSSKHAVMLNARGLITTHGLLQREAEDRFGFFGFPGWLLYQHAEMGLDVEIETLEIYNFQIGGPTSLQTLERVTGESLRDLQFLRFRPTQLNGTVGEIAGIGSEVSRIGMAGTLSYELHGPLEDGPRIYDAIVAAGVGVASGTAYSYYFREVLSHCTIDLACATIGTEVIVQWGEYGGPIKDVRATVARYPYLEAPRYRDVDLAAIPSGAASG
ncbi:MAG TPA: hypothetical protein VNT22_04645 [Baekduia sp.]|nr:hypothetical protein [Baekduia sp.]